MGYATTVRKHRRLAILRHLEQVSGYTTNASILRDVLQGVGVGSTFDQVITELAWLEENGMVTMQDHGDFVIAEATLRGIEIARGEATHPDIQRPRPARSICCPPSCANGCRTSCAPAVSRATRKSRSV